MDRNAYNKWFCSVTGVKNVHHWQNELASDSEPKNRLLNIPTGFGKTAGTVLTWLYHRVQIKDDRWPRRLVYCLPMRVLVEQTESEIRTWLSKTGLLWNLTENQDHSGKVGIHMLMGGMEAGEWHLYPEECAVLIGTQDMLLSRALNRGYAAPRARWPMEFGLLNQDCLWVMDEVQLMDVGLATSAQLQTFRVQDKDKSLCLSYSWWMSATLRRDWLKTVDSNTMVASLPETGIIDQTGPLWEIKKSLRLIASDDIGNWARHILKAHYERRGLTLVVVNTVSTAMELHQILAKLSAKEGVKSELVHSRFRPEERKRWSAEFLKKGAHIPPEGRIIVATQVIEAGVDISAKTLFTELAPWPSLVQRFGRAARYAGENAEVFVFDRGVTDEKKALPYLIDGLNASREALKELTDVSPVTLESVRVRRPELMRKEELLHLFLRRELDELFDTTPDLTGADIDISRFIRSGDERDVQVCWLFLAKNEEPPMDRWPPREALCSVPFLQAQDWLFGKGSANSKPQNLPKNKRVWIWDYLDDCWRKPSRRDLYPGQIIVVAADVGGYDRDRGFDPAAGALNAALMASCPWQEENSGERADAGQERDDNSAYPFRTIATHGCEVGEEVSKIANGCRLGSWTKLLNLAGRWHDVGKAHPAFQNSIKDARGGKRPERSDLAKAPKDAWAKPMYRQSDGDVRPGFRHEFASALALFDVLVRFKPDHEALLGPHRELMVELHWAMPTPVSQMPSSIEKELLCLTADEFNLLVYLVCAHHGKVRGALHAAPHDQEYRDRDGRGLPIRGIREDDSLPSVPLYTRAGTLDQAAECRLHHDPAAVGLSPRTGASWTERIQKLLQKHGPFALAWMEAILRSADIRASRITRKDALLP